MFLWSQTRLLRAETKTMHLMNAVILGVKAIALLLAIGRTIPSRLLDISRLLRLLRYPSGRAIARGASAAFGRTAPTRMRRTRRRFEYPRRTCTPSGSLLASISTHARVKHSYIKVQTASVKLSSQGCRKWTWANFNSQQFLWHSCKNHTNHKLLIFTPL
jgi:hypothetical protein